MRRTLDQLQPAVALGKAALLVRHRFSDGGLRARRHWLERSPIKPWVAPLAAGCIGESGSRLHAVHGLRLKPDSNPRDLLPSVPLCSLCFLLFQISPLRMRRTKMDFYRRSLRTQSFHGLNGSVNWEEAHPKSLFLCSLCFLLFQIFPLPMLRTTMDFYRRSLRTQSPHRLNGTANWEEAHPKSLFLCSLCFLLFQISPLRMRRTKTDFYRRSLRTQSSHGLNGTANHEEAHPKSLILRSLLFPFASFASFCSKSSLSRC